MKSKKLSYLSKSILVYLASVIILCLLSLIGLIWNDFYILTSLGIASLCALVNLILLIKSSEGLKPDAKKSSMVFLVTGNFFRFIMMVAAIGLSALVIYLTKGEGQDNKVYLNILASGIPFFVMTGVLACIKPAEDDVQIEEQASSETDSPKE